MSLSTLYNNGDLKLVSFLLFVWYNNYINLGREEKIIMTYTGKMNKSFIDDIVSSVKHLLEAKQNLKKRI